MSDLKPVPVPTQKKSIPSPGPYVCNTCHGSGHVLAFLISNPVGAYAFNCACGAGQTRWQRFPRWVDADKSKYELIGTAWPVLEETPKESVEEVLP